MQNHFSVVLVVVTVQFAWLSVHLFSSTVFWLYGAFLKVSVFVTRSEFKNIFIWKHILYTHIYFEQQAFCRIVSLLHCDSCHHSSVSLAFRAFKKKMLCHLLMSVCNCSTVFRLQFLVGCFFKGSVLVRDLCFYLFIRVTAIFMNVNNLSFGTTCRPVSLWFSFSFVSQNSWINNGNGLHPKH